MPLEKDVAKHSVEYKGRVYSWLTKVNEGAAYHYHTETCKKNGCEGTDLSCRLHFPRLLVRQSHFPPGSDGSIFLLRRDQGNIVPYCRALMMAVPGNQMISIVADNGRFIREHHLWKEAVKKGSEVRAAGLSFSIHGWGGGLVGQFCQILILQSLIAPHLLCPPSYRPWSQKRSIQMYKGQ